MYWKRHKPKVYNLKNKEYWGLEMQNITMKVNGKLMSGVVEGRTLLFDFLRNNYHLTDTHVGCGTGRCRACTLHVNGVAIKS